MSAIDCAQCSACAACDGSCGVCPYADQTKHYHEPRYGVSAFCGHEDCDRPDPHLMHEVGHRFYASGHPRVSGCTRCGHLPTDPIHQVSGEVTDERG